MDAARLDIEMSAMLKEQLVKVFSLMKVLERNQFQVLINEITMISGGC